MLRAQRLWQWKEQKGTMKWTQATLMQVSPSRQHPQVSLWHCVDSTNHHWAPGVPVPSPAHTSEEKPGSTLAAPGGAGGTFPAHVKTNFPVQQLTLGQG